MKNFDDCETYLAALAKQPKLALVPIAMAASVMNCTPPTIKNWIRDGKIDGIKIHGKQYVLASALHAKVSARDDEVIAVKKRLIEILREDRRFVYYSDIMREFGYDSSLAHERKYFGTILYYVSKNSHKEIEANAGEGNGGLLSSMVWNKDKEFVGAGYWGWGGPVNSLGYEEPSDDDAEAFVEDHIDRCIKYYVE